MLIDAGAIEALNAMGTQPWVSLITLPAGTKVYSKKISSPEIVL